MHTLPRFSENYGFTVNAELDGDGAILAHDIDHLLDEYEDDWSLDMDEDDLELLH